ncbi:hypothetical protein HOP50_04g31050 [Chloropicon primus]|nr:hypothetical protein HOP50_04g31050 [Chloropicon primus]
MNRGGAKVSRTPRRPRRVQTIGRNHLCRLALALVFLVGALSGLVGASRFRYGTLSWVPTNTIDSANDLQTVEFTIRASFRRDYEWGSYYNEQWAQTAGSSGTKVFYGSEGALREGSAGFDKSLSGCTDEALSNVFTQNACFNCPAGSTAGYFGCEYTSPHVDYKTTDSSGNGVFGERFFIRFPPKKQNDGTTDVVPCPSPFHCDAAKAETSSEYPRSTTFTTEANTVASALCDDYGNNPTKDAGKCAPWSELYGMFMGDGSSKTIELEVTDVNSDDSSRLGNSVTGVGTFTHAYKRNTADPFVAFFTGGERFYECDYPANPLSSTGACDGSLNVLLNNNQQGRYRLEVEVWLKGDGNRSPVVHQPPVLPIPHQLPGIRAKFQIAAMDPDGDALTFRFGDKIEMGGITRSKTEAFPYSQNVGLTGQARASYDTTGKILANFGLEYGPYECDIASKAFSLTGRCPSDREPQEISGLSTHSFTSSVPGLVEWNTWTATDGSPCAHGSPVEGVDCAKLRSGFYNMVVMVSDKSDARASGVKVPVDFMTYLYDGPMHFCDKNCKKGFKPGLATHADLDGVHESCSVCGYGEGNMTLSSCHPEIADGECGITHSVWNSHEQILETSIVPNPTSACKMNTAPVFATTGLVNGILNNPRLDMYEKSVQAGAQQKPAVTKYLGETFEFYVTAVDTDDCADLSVHAVGLPVGATLSTPEVSSDSQGKKVRRKFTWDSIGGSDTRPTESLVCFYASDNYLVTAEPYYCIELHLQEKPGKEEETLLRFDCKLALNWEPNLKRFVVVEGSSRYYTASSYEDYTWHHAMVSIDEGGLGKLYVDGATQELEIHVGLDSSDSATYDKGTGVGNFFQTTQYPNKCDGTSSSSRRRNLQSDMYGGMYSATDGYTQAEAGLDPAGTSCCSFRMAEGCTDDSTHTFDGLMDEVAVWNRVLDEDEVASTLFHMPKSLASRELEGPRGDQVDFAAGRTLYSRFNNPCTEGPALSTAVSDESGKSAYTGDTADERDDGVTVAAGRKYVYTGVPWATPSVTHTTVDNSSLPIDGDITIVLYGVGFAKSPFMKCVSGLDTGAASDVGAYDYGYKNEGSTTLVSDGSELSQVMVSAATVSHQPNDLLPHLVVESDRHPAQKTYEGQLRSDWHVTTEDKAAASGGNMRFGNIPPFQAMPDHSWMGNNLRESFIYGSYEAAICKLPKGIYPSQSYYLGLSNDAGISGSPKHKDMTYSEFSMKTSATASVQLTTEAKGKTFALWFLPEQEGDATLLLLSNNLAVLWQNRQIKLMDSSNVLTTSGALDLNEWHHVTVVVDDDDNARVYTDGDASSPAPVASVLGGYSLINLANGFVGYVDELKVLKEAVDQSKVHDVMFTRYAQTGDVYYRFNTNTGYIATPLQTAVSIVPTAVPWEPVSVKTIKLRNQIHDVSERMSERMHVAMVGGEEVVVEGFNMAPSKWLKCNFGSYGEHTPSVEQNLANVKNAVGSALGEGTLDRPDGRTYNAVQSDLRKLDRSGSTVSSNMTKISDKSFKCDLPAFDDVALTKLGFGEVIHPEPVSVEVMEVSLGCDGSSFVEGFSSASSMIETNYNGYSMALWAKSDYLHFGGSQTVLAFQTLAGQTSASITYDGKAFGYYDNKIQEVRSEITHAYNAWYHVAVTVNDEGEGTLYLDGDFAKNFTTSATPFPSNKLTLCAGLDSSGKGENFFLGFVDEVYVFKGALSADQVKSLTVNAEADQVVANLGSTVSFYTSKGDSNFDIEGMSEYKSDVPWAPTGSSSSSTPSSSGSSQDVVLVLLGATGQRNKPWGTFASSNPDSILALSGDGSDIKVVPTSDYYNAISARGSLTDETACAYMRVNYPSPHLGTIGGFKLYCLTKSATEGNMVYVNGRGATALEASVLQEPLKTLFSGTTLLAGLDATLAEVWLFDRTLTAEEVDARYKVDDQAVDLSKTPVYLGLPGESSFPQVSSFEFWVKPAAFDTESVLLRTSNFEIGFSGTPGSGGSLRAVVNVSESGCTCTSCLAYEEHTSWKATLMPNTWAHVGIGITGKTMLFFVDGILVDEVTFQDAQALSTYSALDGDDFLAVGEDFDGLLYDIRLSTAAKKSSSYRTTTQCPTTEESGDIYFPLNTGFSGEYDAQSGVRVRIPQKSAWTDASFDDATYLPATSFYGPGLTQATSGTPGRFTITANTACLRKRKGGGDNFEVEFQSSADGTKTTMSALDDNDGNYHVSYLGLQCGTHQMSVSSNGTLVQAFTVDVAPSSTSASASHVVDLNSIASPNVIGCFGSFARFNIQSMDDYGCKSGIDGSDKWVASITGPDSFVVNGVHTMNGLYEVSFVPPAEGKYTVEVKLGDTTVTHFCIEVCVGSSMYFYGDNAVEFADAGDTFSLDGNTGLTMEAWVKPLSDSGRDAYILLKDSHSQKDKYIKGYELALTDSLSSVSASVYVGAGEIRSISAPISSFTTWTHLSVVYTGAEMNVYVNGVLKASKPFAESKPVHVNPYSHPLTVGYGFSGMVDEVKVFSYGKSASQVVESMYCPAFLEKTKLVAYVGFNKASEGLAPTALTGTKTSGSLTGVKGTAVGPTPAGQVTDTDTPYASASGQGVGTIGAAYTKADMSSTTTAGLFIMSLEAKDKCGFRYTGTHLQAEDPSSPGYNSQGVKVHFKPFERKYLKTEPAHVIGEAIAGTIYPNIDFRCGTNGGIDGTNSVTAQLSKAGNYSVTVSVGGEISSEHEILVTPAEFAAFEVIQPAFANIVAGVSSSLGIVLMDSHGNSINEFYDSLHETDFGGESWSQLVHGDSGSDDAAAESSRVSDDLKKLRVTSHAFDFVYDGVDTMMRVFFHAPGNHTIEIEADTAPHPTVHTFSVMVNQADDWVSALTNGLEAPTETDRLKPTVVAYGKDLFVWGGARAQGGLPVEYKSDMYKLSNGLAMKDSLAYKRTIGSLGNLKASSAGGDVVLELTLNTLEIIGMGRMSSSCMDMVFTLPNNGHKLPHYIHPIPGCMAEDTKVFLRIPQGTEAASLDMYYGNSHMVESGGVSDEEEAKKVFDVVQDVGNMSPSSATVQPYKLLATLYDSHASAASQWISPNYRDGSTEFVAAGVHTVSHADKYCTASPWKASSLARSQGHHSIEIVGTKDSTTITMDGVVIKQDSVGSKFEGVTVSSQFVTDGLVYVMPYSSGLSPVSSSGTAGDERVSWVSDRSWQPVATTGSPTARYGQAGSLLKDTYYLFGGERSGYAFSDLWTFDFASSAFSFVPVASASPSGRYDHAAVALDGETFVVIGGRDSAGNAHRDMWAYTTSTNAWSKVGEIASPAFGLAAASAGGDVYVFGGMEPAGLVSNRFQKCTPQVLGGSLSFTCSDITGGCPLELGQSVLDVGISPRYEHSMFTYGADVYVYGGGSSSSEMADPKIYKFEPSSCGWLCERSSHEGK